VCRAICFGASWRRSVTAAQAAESNAENAVWNEYLEIPRGRPATQSSITEPKQLWCVAP
jgi:hypothetical protein